MASTKRKLSILKVGLLACVIALAGCESMPFMNKGDGKKAEKVTAKEQTDKTAKEGDKAPPIEILPNPYLEQNVDVPKKAKALFAQAKSAMKAKKWKAAERLLILMTETYPKLSGPYVNLGIVHRERKQFDDAEKAFKYAIQTNKLNLDAYTQLGLLYREKGKFTEAEKTYQQALTIWPHHVDSLINLGILYDMYMGKFKQALVQYELSQRVSQKPNKKVKGWIVDIKRRIAAEERQAKKAKKKVKKDSK